MNQGGSSFRIRRHMISAMSKVTTLNTTAMIVLRKSGENAGFKVSDECFIVSIICLRSFHCET
jgi:hypothetical protein